MLTRFTAHICILYLRENIKDCSIALREASGRYGTEQYEFCWFEQELLARHILGNVSLSSLTSIEQLTTLFERPL